MRAWGQFGGEKEGGRLRKGAGTSLQSAASQRHASGSTGGRISAAGRACLEPAAALGDIEAQVGGEDEIAPVGVGLDAGAGGLAGEEHLDGGAAGVADDLGRLREERGVGVGPAGAVLEDQGAPLRAVGDRLLPGGGGPDALALLPEGLLGLGGAVRGELGLDGGALRAGWRGFGRRGGLGAC